MQVRVWGRVRVRFGVRVRVRVEVGIGIGVEVRVRLGVEVGHRTLRIRNDALSIAESFMAHTCANTSTRLGAVGSTTFCRKY